MVKACGFDPHSVGSIPSSPAIIWGCGGVGEHTGLLNQRLLVGPKGSSPFVLVFIDAHSNNTYNKHKPFKFKRYY